MIEGGGLGVFQPERVGPMSVQVANGVVDVAVADEAEAVAVAKRYLSYFQGPVAAWSAADQRDAAPRRPREPAAGLRHARRSSTCSPTPARCSSCAAASAPAWSPRWPGSRAGRRHRRQQPAPTWAAPSTATAPTRRPGSCSSATPSTCRSSRCATRPGFMVGPEAEKTRAGPPRSAGCSSPGPTSRVPFGPSWSAQGLRARARRRMAGGSFRAAVVRGRLADRRVRRHGPRGRGAARLPQGARGGRGPGRAPSALSTRWSRARTRTARRSTPPATSRSTTSSTPPRRGDGSRHRSPRRRRRRRAAGKKRPFVDTW